MLLVEWASVTELNLSCSLSLCATDVSSRRHAIYAIGGRLPEVRCRWWCRRSIDALSFCRQLRLSSSRTSLRHITEVSVVVGGSTDGTAAALHALRKAI